MKKLFLITTIALTLFFSYGNAQYSTKDTSFVSDYYAAASVDTNYVTWSGQQPTRFVNRTVIIENQSSTATDTLWIWFDNDSTKLKKYVLPGKNFITTRLLKSVNTRAGITGTIRREITVSQGPAAPEGNAVVTTTRSSTDSSLWVLIDTVRFTRPATNATAYADGDIVRTLATTGGALITFTAARTNGGGGYITAVQLSHDTANVNGANFDIMFYNDSTGMGATLPADNAVFQTIFDYGKGSFATAPLSLTMYGTNGGGATGARGDATGLNIPFRCISGSTKIYAVLIARGAFTPKNGGIFRLKIFIQPTN